MLGEFAASRAVPSSSSLQTKLTPLRMPEYFPNMVLYRFLSRVVTKGGLKLCTASGLVEKDRIITTFSRENK